MGDCGGLFLALQPMVLEGDVGKFDFPCNQKTCLTIHVNVYDENSLFILFKNGIKIQSYK
jgi:hypothetical protein